MNVHLNIEYHILTDVSTVEIIFTARFFGKHKGAAENRPFFARNNSVPGLRLISENAESYHSFKSSAAASSAMSMQSGCSRNTDAGTLSVTSPFTILRTASALFAPLARISIFFAYMICRMPIVKAWRGTSEISLNRRALSFTVLSARVTTCVPLPNGVPGSLNAIWPLLPSPRS